MNTTAIVIAITALLFVAVGVYIYRTKSTTADQKGSGRSGGDPTGRKEEPGKRG